MDSKTRFITYNGIGIALFVVLTMCLQVPVFENYYLCLGYLVMMVYCTRFGAVSGSIVGTFGVILYCVLTSGLRGMPGWTLGNLLIGIVLGTVLPKLMKNSADRRNSALLRYALMVIIIIAVTAAAILGVKSLTECLLYGQPMVVRIVKNSYAFVADAFMMIVSIPICELLSTRFRTA